MSPVAADRADPLVACTEIRAHASRFPVSPRVGPIPKVRSMIGTFVALAHVPSPDEYRRMTWAGIATHGYFKYNGNVLTPSVFRLSIELATPLTCNVKMRVVDSAQQYHYQFKPQRKEVRERAMVNEF